MQTIQTECMVAGIVKSARASIQSMAIRGGPADPGRLAPKRPAPSLRKGLAKIVPLGMLLVAIAGASRAEAQETALDVVLALDTSGSMKKTDPKGLRVEAVRLIGSLLPKEDRLALLLFDTQARVALGLDSMDVNEPKLRDLLGSIGSDGRFTNLYAALGSCRDLLLGGSKDQKTIILLTDGKMDTGDSAQDQRLKEKLLSELSGTFAAEGIPVYAIAFSPFSDADLLFQVAVKTRGFFYLVENASELSEVFVRIYENIAHPNGLSVSGRSFRVDESVQSMKIVVTKKDPTQKVVLKRPDLSLLDGTQTVPGLQWFKGQAFDLISVAKPPEGGWEFEQGVQAEKSIFISTDLNLKTSFDENLLSVSEERPVEAWLERQGLQVSSADLRAEGVEIGGEVLSSSGWNAPLVLQDKGGSGDRLRDDGIFTAVLRAGEPGQYRLRLWARGETFDRLVTREFAVVPQREDTLAGPPATKILTEPSPSKDAEPSSEKAEQQSLERTRSASSAKLWLLILAAYGVLTSLLCARFYFGWRRSLRLLKKVPEPPAQDEGIPSVESAPPDLLEETNQASPEGASSSKAESERGENSDEGMEERLQELADSFRTYLKYQELRMLEFSLSEKAVDQFRQKVAEMTTRNREAGKRIRLRQAEEPEASRKWNWLVEELERSTADLHACLQILEQECRLQSERRRRYENRMNAEIETILLSLKERSSRQTDEERLASDEPTGDRASKLRVRELTQSLLEKEEELLKLRDAYTALEQEYIKNYRQALSSEDPAEG